MIHPSKYIEEIVKEFGFPISDITIKKGRSVGTSCTISDNLNAKGVDIDMVRIRITHSRYLKLRGL